jgi:cell division septum initiation protein DivIVA
MSAQLHADDEAVRPSTEVGAARVPQPRNRRRPNVSGDLPTLFETAPMFRRVVAGYDRYQVDTYVRWAEDELATADREREHLLGRHLSTRAALDEAHELLAHSAGGGEFLTVSRQIGSMLAAAADEAEGLRSEAAAERSAAATEAQQLSAQADRVLADAVAEARRMAEEAVTETERMVAEAAAQAGRLIEDAELTGSEARAEADARLAKVRDIEQRAAEYADQLRRQAATDAAAALVQARDEVIGMLTTGREARRRADAEAAEARARVDREAAARSAVLLAEVAALEQRRSLLQTEVDRLTALAARAGDPPLDVHLGRLLERLRWRTRSLRTH